MSDSTFTLTAEDGVALNCFRWQPATGEATKGVIQIVHGLAEHAARYERFALQLNKAGYAVYAHDQRGHGKSIQDPKEQGYYADQDGWNKVIGDVRTLNQEIKKAHDGLPLLLLGHSMGSMVSQEYIIRHSDTVDGVILSASIDNGGLLLHIGLLVARLERMRLGKHGNSKILHAMSFGDYNKPFKPNRTEYDWLSRDEAEVDKYIEDPLCGFVATTNLWVEFLVGIREFARSKRRSQVRNDLPLFLLTGDKDPVTQMGKAVDALHQSYVKGGMQDVTVKKYPGARHECLNETNRDEVAQDIIDWSNRVVSAL